MNECMNEGRLNYKLIPMCVSAYLSLLHDSASGGARTALAPCLETWLAPRLAPCYGSRHGLLRATARAMACSVLWLAPADIVLTCYDMAATTSAFTTLDLGVQVLNLVVCGL